MMRDEVEAKFTDRRSRERPHFIAYVARTSAWQGSELASCSKNDILILDWNSDI